MNKNKFCSTKRYVYFILKELSLWKEVHVTVAQVANPFKWMNARFYPKQINIMCPLIKAEIGHYLEKLCTFVPICECIYLAK